MDPVRSDTETPRPNAQIQETPEDVSDWHFVKLAGSSDCGSENVSLASENAEAHSNEGSAGISAVTTASEEHANAVLQEPVERLEQAVEERLEAHGPEEAVVAEAVGQDSANEKDLPSAEASDVGKATECNVKLGASAGSSCLQQLISKACSLDAVAMRMAVVTYQNLHSLKASSVEVLSSWFSVVNAWLDTISKHHLLPKPISQAVFQLRMQLKSAQVNWGIVSLSASLLVVSTAFLATAVHNKHLSRQLRQKDRELAKLVMKIFNLQDALQGLRQTPLIRHTSIGTFATHPVF